MLRLCKQIGMRMSLKKTLKLKTAEFLTIDAGAVLRNMPTAKERKYKNVEITEDFKKIDEKRKKQRYENIKKRQLLLQKKLQTQAKLLTGPEAQSIKTELQELEKLVAESSKQIEDLTQIIDATEATHIIAEGPIKIAILNHIKYLEYLETHEAGSVLHPETIKAIQSVHYCVNNNLPINRIKLYEIIPELFEEEIGQLEQSVQKLIAQKQIFIEDDDSKSTIRFFEKIQYRGENPVQQIFDDIQQALYKTEDYCKSIIDEHQELLEKVAQGKTPFRDLEHLRTVLLSDLPIKYLPEEEALRKDLFKVQEILDQWRNYRAVREEEAREIQRQYIEPPLYIKRHPKLLELHDKFMQIYTNPQPLQDQPWIVTGDQTQVLFGKKMEEQIRSIVKQKFDPMFVEAMNTDRSKIDKKKLEIEFYNLSTSVMENLQALEDKSKDQQEFIQALPQEKSLLTKQAKKNLISHDHISRILYLNKLDKNKYNLEFFSKWFGVDQEQLAAALKFVSYLRVPLGKSDVQVDESQVQVDIFKFQF